MSQKDRHFAKREKVYGQFFTPPAVANFIVRFALKFLEGERRRAIDPACGDGVFLSALLDEGFEEVWGVDVDPSVVRLVPERVRERARIVVADALARGGLAGPRIPEGYFDLVVGNPPFSSKYGRVSDSRLSLYELGRGRRSQAIEVLFLERFIQLARPGGVVGIILPEGVLASKSMQDVREFVLRYRLLAVVSLPRGIFRGTLSTSSKTHVLFLKKEPSGGGEALMVEVGGFEELDNVDSLLKRGLRVVPVAENLTPSFYTTVSEPRFREGLEVRTLGELVEEVRTGATEYGAGRVFSSSGLRFISAKVVTPLGLDFSRDERFVEPGSIMDKPRARVKPGDVLFVRVGVGCAGRACVVVDESDVGVADDWIYIIRLKDRELLPYYVAVFMQSEAGKRQIEKMKRGVGTVNIPKSELLKLNIPIPPEDFLRKTKETYLEMVKAMRAGRRKEAERMLNELIRLVEETVLNT